MKVLFLLIFVGGYLTACSGVTSGGGSGGSTGVTNGWTTYSVETSSALPSCSGDIVGRLYYVEDSQVFRVCKAAGWQTIVLGNAIVSNQIISYTNTDYCTQYDGESCGFSGGQLVRYADGSVMLLGSWTFLYTNATDHDTDSDVTTISVVYPPTVTTAWQRLSPFVARGTGYKAAFLVYTRSPESIRIVHDTDGDGIPEVTDQVLYTAALNNW